MLYSEFCSLCNVDASNFTAMDYHTFIEPFYTESQDISDVNGKQQFAVWFARQRKAFDRLHASMAAVAKAEVDNYHRSLELGSQAEALKTRENWISKRENDFRTQILKIREALEV